MDLIKNKKGIFFLMLTLILISLFVLSIGFFSGLAYRKAVQERVESLSEFVSATESDLNRQIFISGYRAIFFMEKEIVDNGYYVNDVNLLLQEMFFNGTINGEPEPLLQSVTFAELEQLVSERAARISASADFSNPSINITQDDPWNVKVVFVSDFYIADKNNLASWNKTISIEVPIAIFNFTDPVYFVETAGNVDPPTFARTPYSSFDSSTLAAHIAGKYYREHSDAPSFLDRLEGNLLASSPYGIESLVNVPDIPPAYQTGRSIVDHIYFDGSETGCHLSGMAGWVKLDEVHRTYYGSISCG
jgi:hypothetical protein